MGCSTGWFGGVSRPPLPVPRLERVRTPAVRSSRRAAALLLGGGLLGGVLLSGCGASVRQAEFTVYFKPDATTQQKDALRNACPGVGKATLEPRDRSNLDTARTYPVRYDISKASPPERAAVIKCVSAQPGVRGISQSDIAS